MFAQSETLIESGVTLTESGEASISESEAVIDEQVEVIPVDRFHQTLQHHRLLHAGWITLSIVICLVITMAYLKINHATRGLHSGRLQFVVGLAILAIIVASMVVSVWVLPWN